MHCRCMSSEHDLNSRPVQIASRCQTKILDITELMGKNGSADTYRCCYSMTFGSLYFSLSFTITTDKITPLSYSFIRIALCHPHLCFSLISRNHGPSPEHSYCLPLFRFLLVPTLWIPFRHSSSPSDHDSPFVPVARAMTHLPFLSIMAFLL